MDKSIVNVEENHRGICNSSASASKSLRSIAQSNSTTMDFSTAVEDIGTLAHRNFSIRGYVAGMRIKNGKLCLPFAPEAGFGESVDNLPPLYVPRFQWWRCLNRVSDFGTVNTSLQESILPHRSNDHISTSLSIDGEKDGPFSARGKDITNAEIQGHKHRSRGFGDGENGDPSTNILNINPCQTEGRKASTCGKSGTDVRDKKSGNPSFVRTEPNPCQSQDRRTNATDIPKYREIGVPKTKTLRNDNGDIGLQVELHDKAVTSDTAHVNGIPSFEGDEPDNASSGSDDNSSGLPHRRKPKLRYLADILEDEGNQVNEHPKVSHASSSKMHVLWSESGATQKKRKIPCVEDKRPQEMIHPSSAAKKLGTSALDAEKTCRRVEISNSKPEGDASTKLDLRLDTETQWIKRRKNKDVDHSGKLRQMHVEARIVSVQEVPKRNDVDSADMLKQAIVAETCSFKSVRCTSPLGQTGPCFRISQSGQQMERNSNLSKNKKPEVEAGHKSLVLSSTPGECNISGKVALDLSLGSIINSERKEMDQLLFLQRTIPDKGPQRKDLPLNDNQTLVHKTAMMQGKPLPNLLENRSSPLLKTLDISASYIQEKARKGQVHPGLSRSRILEKTDTRNEFGAPDDVTMEIAELMAKNQQERTLGNSWKYFLPEATSTTIRESPILHGDENAGMKFFSLTNPINGVNVGRDNMGTSGNSPNQFSQLNRTQFDLGKLEERGFKFFSPCPQNQGSKMQFSAPGSVIKGSRLGEGEDSLWSLRRENLPDYISVPQNRSNQSNNLGMHSFSDQRHKGKTISDIKGAEEKLVVRDRSFPKPGIIGSNPKSVGSLDPYKNDTIPAMQLLSLMDQAMISSSSFNVGVKSIVNKSFSPCNYPLSFNGDKHQSLLNGSRHRHSKELPGSVPDVYYAGESSKKSSSYLHRKTVSKSLELDVSGRSQRSRTANGALISFRDSSTGVDKKIGHLDPSHSRNFPRQSHGDESTDFEAPSDLLTPPPLRNRSEVEVCTINLNPADFSIPDAQNEYTISSKDLEFRKRNASKERSRSGEVDRQKRRRKTKDVIAKEYRRK
ncbi:protein EMBRYONIC FLOWER 1-like [Forsythia ovata]|uniref:Protein EMBRYONIC FLOWER 1-like n=1 Tax=Forsythia ovata TaxID=205694 RepID=A0ABD1W1Q0_9LAMI